MSITVITFGFYNFYIFISFNNKGLMRLRKLDQNLDLAFSVHSWFPEARLHYFYSKRFRSLFFSYPCRTLLSPCAVHKILLTKLFKTWAAEFKNRSPAVSPFLSSIVSLGWTPYMFLYINSIVSLGCTPHMLLYIYSI